VKVAVVGGGIVGLFTAFYLERAGVEVTLYEEGKPGARSDHAAGIIEPATAYRTNTFAFLRRVWKLWRCGTCTFRSVDGRWLTESLRQLERAPIAGTDDVLREMAETSVAGYAELADRENDFLYVQKGLLELYDDRDHFLEDRAIALSRGSTVPVEVREEVGSAGALFYPSVGWLHTERFVDRILRELTQTRLVRQRVTHVGLDGSVRAGGSTAPFDAVAVSTGVTSRKLGLPLTGVKGYGWHVRSPTNVEVATIYADRGIAVVPFPGELKVTGGWDFDLSASISHSRGILAAVKEVVSIDRILDFNSGSRPCTPDGLPIVGRKDRLIIANGGFRLGWSFAPALGRHAALLCMDRADNDPFLARYCGSLHAGPV
jgi:glycine/D-amino acid oxidase-like deaminating enzyme